MSDTTANRPLDGVRVVDFGQYLAGPLLAAFLADAGADVVRVDPPTGPRWQHPADAMLQRGKRSIALDLHDGDDRNVARRLVERAEIVVENFRPGVMDRLGLDPESALAANPRLLYCSLPGFGADDPRAAVPGWEGVVSAAAGLYLYPGCTPMDYVGDRSGEPIYSAIPAASSYAVFVAAHSVAAALVARERTGAGQRIEVSLFDACFELIGASVMKTDRPPAAPAGPRITAGLPQLGHYRCADGRWLELCLFQDKHLRWFAETFLPPEFIEDDMGDAEHMLTEPALQERARKRYAELLATRPARDWEIAINEQSGASAAVCQTSEEWLTLDSHARDSGAVIELHDPEYGTTYQAEFPIRMSSTPPAVNFPRRPLDADRAEILAELARPVPVARTAAEETISAPLDGIRVLDVSQVLAGPTIGRILAEYGAEVIKIHSFLDRQLGMHLYTNSGKRSIMLDLKAPDGMAVFERISDGIDVFTQNFTRGVADRMGIGDTALRERNPGLIYVSISAFGHEGYRGGWRGREQLGQGPTGMQIRLGGDGEPSMAPYPCNDYGSGNLAAFATLLALYHRLRGGAGQHVQSSLTHSSTFLQIPYMVAHPGRVWDEPRGQSTKGPGTFARLYPAADRWFYLCSPDGLDGVPELAGLAEERLAEVFRTRPAQEWVDRLVAAGAGAHILIDQPDLMDAPVVQDRGLALERDHPGFGRARMAGPSFRLSRTPPRAPRPVGPPGADTPAVLADFGFDSDDLIARDIARDGLPEGTTFVGMFR
ncbi:Crotonobetainyl-CoA:carnitine CoA-transferase CaiB [Prauserella aidingensis]|uniref:CaiB/BaiF CoA transferase family protein n=1 Tax=Prauserella aidingensis TaxID=387890 RepID=UPI0020A56383|nr:CoA transferase [Prauserella aidingensis]MCP2256136.1 Crotonobetainyl-CoA:carnitine CoA-transferase CaiB [Prauserella aidingensis]